MTQIFIKFHRTSFQGVRERIIHSQPGKKVVHALKPHPGWIQDGSW